MTYREHFTEVACMLSHYCALQYDGKKLDSENPALLPDVLQHGLMIQCVIDNCCSTNEGLALDPDQELFFYPPMIKCSTPV